MCNINRDFFLNVKFIYLKSIVKFHAINLSNFDFFLHITLYSRYGVFILYPSYYIFLIFLDFELFLFAINIVFLIWKRWKFVVQMVKSFHFNAQLKIYFEKESNIILMLKFSHWRKLFIKLKLKYFVRI